MLHRHYCGIRLAIAASTLLLVVAAPGASQAPGVLPNVKMGGSSNVKVLSHIPLGGFFRVGDVALEQEPNRPYAYVGQMMDHAGFTIVGFKDPDHARALYHWSIENAAGHHGLGGLRPRYFKSRGRYYVVQGMQFDPGTVDADLGAVVFDVTSLPDTTRIREVARLRVPEYPGGFRDLFTYKHSDGHALLFAAVNGPGALVYDLDLVVQGRMAAAKIGNVPVPDAPGIAGPPGYNGIDVQFDPLTSRDKFYGAGKGGYYVYDITQLAVPRLLTSIVGAAGILSGASITPSPDGRFVVTGTDYQYAPLRWFDLREGLAGRSQTISRSVGAWVADWRNAVHHHEVRWPFVFVSSYEDGLQIVNMVDPTDPKTVGWYYTCLCQHEAGLDPTTLAKGTSVTQGAVGIDVRNSDGLMAVSDANTGLWLFRLDGFGGWNGNDWGVPNVSSAQDWDLGPRRGPVLLP